MLNVTSISKSYGTRTLFSNLSFSLSAGDRLAVIGANGTGKTTLLNILAGIEDYDSGSIHLQRGATLGYLEQEISAGSGKDLLSEVSSARSGAEHLAHKRQIIHEELSESSDPSQQAFLMHELEEIEAHFEHSGGYTVEFEAKTILTGLGFRESEFSKTIGEFSGGWRMRAGLAKLLISDPDILFLDEPTNHLDLDAIIWFEKYLQSYTGAVILISHDRAFINRISTRILAFEPEGVRLHRGSYDSYRISREKEEDIISATIKNQERFIESEMKFINRFRAKNTKSTQVQSRLRRLEKMEVTTSLRTPPKVRIKIPESPRSGKNVISLEHAGFSYGDSPLYRELHFTLCRGDRVALIGPNGAGKSTLLKLLAGILSPTSGKRILGYNVTGAYYAQHQTEQLLPHITVLEEMKRSASDESEERLRTMLGSFLFRGDDVKKKVAVLSGGEKARLALAKIFIRPANLILMDEPTNHLDIPSRDILAEALASYDGTLALVTHDRDLIERISTHILEIREGDLTLYHGTYSDYLYRKENSVTPTAAPTVTSPVESADDSASAGQRSSDKERKRQEAEIRNRFYRESKQLQNRIRGVETEMEKNDRRKREIEGLLENPSLSDDRESFNRTLNEYEAMKNCNTALNEEWIALSLKLEEMRKAVFGKGKEPES
jgi:ATP-binding cassette, subfamily F, member 3